MEEREKNLLMVFGAALVLAGFYYGILPMYYEYNRLAGKIDENISKIQRAQREASRLESLVNELKQTKIKLKEARQKLPAKGRFRELMSALESQARNAGIPDRKILEFSQGGRNVIKGGMVEEMSISARFDAISMNQLVEMLWRFDNMIRMLDIKSFESFTLQRLRDDDRFYYNVNMQMTVYILRDKEPGADKGDQEA